MQDFDNETLQKRHLALLNFIHKLCDENNLKQHLDEYVGDIKNIYSDGWRHSYSVVTQYFLLNYSPNKFDEVLSDLVSKLLSLLKYLIDNKNKIFNYDNGCSDEQKENEIEYRNCRRNIEKLVDHLNLELIRKRYIDNLYKKVEMYSLKVNKDVNRLNYAAIGTIKRIKSEVDDVSEKLNKENKEQKKESITILGIFSSIVTVLAASIGLSSAIFANMNSVGTWKLYALTCLIVLFITNILFLLFDFLRDITGEETIDLKQNNKETVDIKFDDKINIDDRKEKKESEEKDIEGRKVKNDAVEKSTDERTLKKNAEHKNIDNVKDNNETVKDKKELYKDRNKHEYLWILNILLILVSFLCFIISSNDPLSHSSNHSSSVENCTNNCKLDLIPKP